MKSEKFSASQLRVALAEKRSLEEDEDGQCHTTVSIISMAAF